MVMGTNYYIRNRNGIKEELIHIGKRSNDEFLWAIEKEELLKIFKETPGLVIINDNYKEKWDKLKDHLIFNRDAPFQVFKGYYQSLLDFMDILEGD